MNATNTVINLNLVMAHRGNIHSLDLWTFIWREGFPGIGQSA